MVSICSAKMQTLYTDKNLDQNTRARQSITFNTSIKKMRTLLLNDILPNPHFFPKKIIPTYTNLRRPYNIPGTWI